MADEEILVLGGLAAIVGGTIAIWTTHITRRSAERMKRLELLQQALQHPAIDDATKSELVRLLAEDQRRSKDATAATIARLRTIGRTLLLGAGWVMFIGGGAMLAVVELGLMPRLGAQPAWTFMILGFLAMSLPVAVRELVARSEPTSARP